MEKDVLIEKIAAVLALISRNMPVEQLSESEDSKNLSALLRKVYGTGEDELDFKDIVRQCNEIKTRHINLVEPL
jgi:hypothetical protein